jgi:hypothetical protein
MSVFVKSFARFTEEKRMFYWRSLWAAFLAALLSAGLVMAGSVASGPQVGDKVPGPFKPMNVTGEDAGKAACQYCKNGPRPVAVIFAKQVTPALAQLIKRIDAATVASKDGMGSYVVICSDAPGVDRQLLGVAQQMQIQQTVLTTYKAGGPEKYRLNPQADVTVLLYNHFTVKANHAFQNAELTETAINAIVVDLGKMLADN